MIEFAQHPTAPELDAAGEVIAATDWLGNSFTVGDLVMYCIGAGRGQMMAIGRVLKMKTETKKRYAGRDENGVQLYAPYDDITVQVFTYRTSGAWDNGQRTRPAWINPMNVTAITGLVGSPHVRDNCQRCQGAKGGVPGNENRVGGETLCDYCTSETMESK